MGSAVRHTGRLTGTAHKSRGMAHAPSRWTLPVYRASAAAPLSTQGRAVSCVLEVGNAKGNVKGGLPEEEEKIN